MTRRVCNFFAEYSINKKKVNPDENRGSKAMGLKPREGYDRQVA